MRLSDLGGAPSSLREHAVSLSYQLPSVIALQARVPRDRIRSWNLGSRAGRGVPMSRFRRTSSEACWLSKSSARLPFLRSKTLSRCGDE
jgi:hypothetical protein